MSVQQTTQQPSQPVPQPVPQPMTQSVSVPMGMMQPTSYAQPSNVAVNMNYGVVNNPTSQAPSQLSSLQINKDVKSLFNWWEYIPILFILDYVFLQVSYFPLLIGGTVYLWTFLPSLLAVYDIYKILCLFGYKNTILLELIIAGNSVGSGNYDNTFDMEPIKLVYYIISLIIAIVFSYFAFKASVPFTFNELKYMLKHQYSRKLQVPNNANNNNVVRK